MRDALLDILVIEDNLAEAHLIKEMLADVRGQEYAVQHVRYLAEGLALLRTQRFDCVLVDLGLPDSRGLESALAVRKEAKHVPIVVLTVLNDEEIALSSLQSDIQDYLIKGEINAALLTRAIRYARQRKAVMEELREANRELEAFNYTVAHDLRQPLNAISAYCQSIEMMCGNDLEEVCLSYLQESYKGTVRMSRLIDSLLNFSRAGRAELRRERVDLSSMAKEAASELMRTSPEREVMFDIDDGLFADGDPNLLRIVLDNLLGNAWKFTVGEQAAVIEVGAVRVNGEDPFYVRDNGPGFEAARAEEIFAPFQRGPGTEKRGFGIGLATVQRIIQRHGGKAWAEGTPGKGATFYFTVR